MDKNKVNLVELCSDLADIAIVKIQDKTGECALAILDNTVVYTDDYQLIFNQLYDEYWNILTTHGFEHENK